MAGSLDNARQSPWSGLEYKLVAACEICKHWCSGLEYKLVAACEICKHWCRNWKV